jgi:ketosteroid isomerase-like protein
MGSAEPGPRRHRSVEPQPLPANAWRGCAATWPLASESSSCGVSRYSEPVPQENIDLISEMYLAFHGGDAERALSYFDEGVVVDATARVDGGMGRGRDALSRIIGQWLGMFDEWREEIEEMRDFGDRVCVVAVQSGRGKDSGLETQARYAVVYEVRDTAITRMTLYRDPAQGLEGAGLQPA